MSDSLPQVLGAYQLKGKLAVGGQSEVWLAVQKGPGGFRRRCALKIVLPPASMDDVIRKNFFAEARLMAQFDHPNLIVVTDLGEDEQNEILYSVMPYVSGRTLASILRDLPNVFSVPEVLWIASRMMLALGHAHQMRDERGRNLNVIHRDISPENILIGFDGQVKLVDFGIALSSINPRSTRLHMVKGKLEFLSPEQASASPHIDLTTDIYSAGLVLYAMFSGYNPLSGDPETALTRARHPRIEKLRKHVDIPEDVEQIVHQMLHMNPHERPTRASDLARAFLYQLRLHYPGYEEVDFTLRAHELLKPYLEGEREFLVDHLAEGTQIIDTRSYGQQSESITPVTTLPLRRKTIPAGDQNPNGDGLADIFRELEEIYED